MIYLLAGKGAAAMAEYCRPDTLFAFDYDGTLTGLVTRPEDARTSAEIEKILYELATLAPVAVISGRGLRDLKERFDETKIHLVGNHGIEGLTAQSAQFTSINAGWVDQLAQFFVRRELDVLIEDKAYSLSVHYRTAPDPVKYRDEILLAVETLAPKPRIIFGDYVVNVIPEKAPHKGDALRVLAKRVGARRSIFIGDDQTDEDVFGMGDANLLCVKVRSPGPAPVPTRANYFLHSQAEMASLLQKMVQILKA
jgi:trehalose 6-phosphate phosphatase